MCPKMPKCELFINTLCTLFLVILPCSKSDTSFRDDDYIYDVEDYYDTPGDSLPMITKSEVFRVHLGESVTLPCNTSDNDYVFERSWTHDTMEILPYSKVNNMEIVDFNDLKINVTSYSDAGLYRCKLKSVLSEIISVEHIVDILPKNLDENKTSAVDAIVEDLTETNGTENIFQNYKYSSDKTEKLLSKDQEVQTQENSLRNDFLTTLSEAIQNNSLSGMWRQRLAIGKSSASSQDNYFWSICYGALILRYFTGGLILL